MTPDEARDLLDGTTPGPWEVRDDAGLLAVIDVEEEPVAIDLDAQDCALVAAAPTLAAMIAGMREEWGITYTGVNHGGRHTEWDYETRNEAERQARRYRLCADMHPIRIVRRYVNNEEEIA